jgi:hypothetical protein
MVNTNFDNAPKGEDASQNKPIISFAEKLAQIKEQKQKQEMSEEQKRKDGLESQRKQDELEEKRKKDIALAPIRKNIQDIKQDLFTVNLVMNSIKGGGGEYDQGIKNFSQNITKEVENRSKDIQDKIYADKEIFDSLDITNTQEFIENSEFANVKDVLDYQQAQQNKEDLEQIDNINFQEKLEGLDIKIEDSKEISYDKITEKLQAKKTEINKKLFTEQLKTPEGKDIVVKELIKEANLPTLRNIFSFSGNRDAYINFYDYQVKFQRPQEKIFTKCIKNIKEKLGENVDQDLIKQSILEQYKGKIDKHIEINNPKSDQALQDKDSQIFLHKIENKLNLEFAQEELKEKQKELNFNTENKPLDSLIKENRTKNEKYSNYLDRISEIKDILYNHPQEIKITENGEIEETNQYKGIRKSEDNISKLLKFEEELFHKYLKEKQKNPLFGKQKHQEKINKIKEDQEAAKQRKKSYEKQLSGLKEGADNLSRAFDLFRYDDNTSLKEIIMKNQGEKRSSEELLKTLNSKIEEMQKSNKIPDQIQYLHSKIKTLEEKLN